MLKVSTQYTDYYKFKNLSGFKKLKHFVSSRINKTETQTLTNFNISLESYMKPDEILANRKTLSKSLDIPLENFVIQNQVHGDTVSVINETYKGKGVYMHQNALQNSDSMITDKKGICLFLLAGDCMPILIYDRKKEIIGAAHSGWKGTVLKIAQKTVAKMIENYNSSPEDIFVGIGPSISVKNYEVGDNVVKAVKETFGTTQNYLEFNNVTGKYHFNLWYSAKYQLTEIGIPENNIEFPGFCTFENNDLFFSARQKDTGRFGAGIMLI